MAVAPFPPNDDAGERRERLRRRLIAARALADVTVDELAGRIKAAGYERGYSAKTIGKMERGETPIQPQTLPVLADACEVPVEFFTADLSKLADGATDVGRQLEELRAQQTEDSVRLAQLEEAVRTLASRDRPFEGEGGARR